MGVHNVNEGRAFLESLLHRELLVLLQDERQRVRGRLYCVDGLKNLVLYDAVEEVWFPTPQTWQERRFSLTVVPAHSVMRVFVAEPSKNSRSETTSSERPRQ
jgi:small nuclear ribonucleoprotein (snRNP)-like protein